MSESSGSRKILGPFNRVEGDLEVHVEVENEHVSKAWVNSTLFRGFEQILHGKDPMDALVYTPRICGICSIAQSVAAAQALATTQGLQACPNGQLATNIILAAENLADHLTHFYLFFMPDFAREVYADQAWYPTISSRFKAQTGSAATDVLPARAKFLHLTGILAGKWPHSLAIQPGGTTRPIEAKEKIRLATTLGQFRIFLESTLFGDQLEAVTAISNDDELNAWQEEHANSDFAKFLQMADSLKLDQLGLGGENLMSYGAYQFEGAHTFKQGIWQEHYQTLDTAAIKEDISHSWLSGQTEAKHPYHGSTIPNSDENSGYSWCKAPRLDQKVMEVGAVSRQMINENPLIKSLVLATGTNVRNRVIARVLELALLVPEMEKWCRQLQAKDTFCLTAKLPDEAQGAGLIEAARGSLGHWLRIKNGRILNYQIIAPTTWNFSPRDQQDQAGALEQALQGTFVGDDEQASVAIQHIIRSFDPCMVCTVH